MSIKWTVKTTKAADKLAARLSERVLLRLGLLFMDLASQGPAAQDWPNYGMLKGMGGDRRHCHLQRGLPTYVCCWEVIDKKRKIIEVYYVGSHEKAPY